MKDFWTMLDELAAASELIIDRPRGSAHPRFPDRIYPLDYGYLADTRSPDGEGMDVWRGSLPEKTVCAVICTVDLMKRDSEIKILIGCTEEEQRQILAFHNDSQWMQGILMAREEKI